MRWRFWRKRKPPRVARTIIPPEIRWNGDTAWVASSWWENQPTSYTYQWRQWRGSVPVSVVGATALSYKVAPGDRAPGAAIDCCVTAHNGDGQITTVSNLLRTGDSGALQDPDPAVGGQR